MLVPLLAFLLLAPDEPRVRPEPLGAFDARLVPEASGVVRSRSRPDVFWTHNDSGNLPVLFAIDRRGKVLRAFNLAIPALDWEDVAVDGRGRVFVGDIGDNKGLLRIRSLYRFDEPDPDRPPTEPLKPTASIHYARGVGDFFNAEGFVIDGDRAVIVVKQHGRGDPELRAVAFDPPAPLSRPAKVERLGALPGFKQPVTGADLSADGRLFVACGNSVVRVYERPAPPSWDGLRMIADVRLEKGPQREGVAWDGGDLILVAEGAGVERLAESVWRSHPPRGKNTKKDR